MLEQYCNAININTKIILITWLVIKTRFDYLTVTCAIYFMSLGTDIDIKYIDIMYLFQHEVRAIDGAQLVLNIHAQMVSSD